MAEIGASSYRRFLPMDKTMLDQILVAYSDSLVRFAYTIVQDATVAEDVAADSIAVLFSGHRKFREEAHLRAFLYRVARNKAIDYLRHHRNAVALEDVENVLGSGDLESGILLSERNQVIFGCMQQLPQQYRQVLQLAYFDDFDVPSICRITRKNTKQVYNILARAKAAMKILLEQEGITHEDL